jgi:DNA invertase Pin-like site-specific DNA recombinase
MHRTDTPKGNRGAAYIRVSDGDKQDPQRQRDTVQRWADNRGLSISRFYEDIEGRNPRAKAERRVHFQQMLADVQAGQWDWVVVDSQERFGTVTAQRPGRSRGIGRPERWASRASVR